MLEFRDGGGRIRVQGPFEGVYKGYYKGSIRVL